MAKNKGVSNELLFSLSRGEWIFGSLLPLFREALINRLRSGQGHTDLGQLPTSFLTAMVYRGLKPIENPVPLSFPKLITHGDETGDQYWNAAVRLAGYGEAKLAVLSDEWGETVQSAMKQIQKASSLTFEALCNNVSFICSLKDVEFRGASSPHFFGTLFMRISTDPEQVAISMVHELAHQELFLMNTVDRLVQKNHDQQLVYSPFQKKSRPPIARLHSAHALFRMIQYQKQARIPNWTQHQSLLSETTATLKNGELSDFANNLLDAVYAVA